MTDKLPDIPYLKLRFKLRALQDCILPPQKGSMLRGGFGHALRNTVCIMKRNQICKTCLIRGQCVYTRVFEPFIEKSPPDFLKGIETAPRAFVIYASETRPVFAKDNCFSFDLILMGKVCELYPYIIYAFTRVVERGLTSRRTSFIIDEVLWISNEPRLLYNGATQMITEKAVPQSVPKYRELNNTVRLQFLTPAHLVINGRPRDDFSFRMLCASMMRRILEIAYFHVPDSEPDWEFKNFLELADKVEIINRELKWETWHRYSNRQKRKQEMRGVTGEIVLKGELARFGHFFNLMEVMHVGKGTVMGMGKVRVVE